MADRRSIPLSPRSRDGLRAANERLADLQAQILVLAATQDIDLRAGSGESAEQIEHRLAEFDRQLIGHATGSLKALAEQVVIWYEKHDIDRARCLLREALNEHAFAAIFKSRAPPSSETPWSRSANVSGRFRPPI